MAEELPAPLMASDVDLRGMEFMPLYGDRLFKSTTWIEARPEAQVAALRLWWHAYAHEVPAASLPNNDRLLAEHAGYGIAVKSWQRIKPQALRGWVLCSDDRWYHNVVAELALEAWAGRVRNREKIRKWREKKGLESGAVTHPVTVTAGGTEPSRNGREGEGQRELQGQGERQLPKEVFVAEAPTGPQEQTVLPKPVTSRSQPSLIPDDDLEMPLMLDRSSAAEAVKAWNLAAQELNAELGRTEWAEVQKLTKARRTLVMARLEDAGGIEGFKIAIAKAKADPWARGDTRRPVEHANWRFNFDYFVKEKSFTQIMEKPHDDGAPSRRQQPDHFADHARAILEDGSG